jgi:general secretion pathway protein D
MHAGAPAADDLIGASNADAVWISRRVVSGLFPALLLAGMLAGCASIRPYVPPSEGHIDARQIRPEPAQAIPPPARVSTFLPPPRVATPVQTYSVVVNEVPVKELLLALARDTKLNIDIHPTLNGLVSLNAVNETLPAILERISKQIDMRYRIEGNTIVLSPDTPYIKTYVVSYVNIQRSTISNTGASGQIATGGAAGAAASGNSSTTEVKTVSTSDFWRTLEQSVRAILNSSLQQSLTAEARLNRIQTLRQEQELRAKQMEAASRAGQAAPALATSLSSGAAAGGQQATLLADDVIVNAVAGTITINGNEKQHQLVQEYLTKVETGAQRQVLIEATIVEVTLSDGYQAGIDWSRVAIGGGFTLAQRLLGGFDAAAVAAGATAGNALTAGYTRDSGNRSLSITLKLLQEFGDTRVLSSPKLMVLNNQTALLKAVNNIVYFEVTAQAGVATAGGVVTAPTFNTIPKTVALGVVMGVTPQVSDDGRVLLTVRPTVTRLLPQTPFVLDPNPSLCNANRSNCLPNPVPQVQVREMESVLQVGNGQTVILGGLMQDDVQRNREQLPGADKLQDFGELFRFRNERASKSELVIFLRPTVVANPTLDSDELRFFQRFLPQPEGPPQTPRNTGAAR